MFVDKIRKEVDDLLHEVAPDWSVQATGSWAEWHLIELQEAVASAFVYWKLI